MNRQTIRVTCEIDRFETNVARTRPSHSPFDVRADVTILSAFIALVVLSAIFFLIERLGRGGKQRVLRLGWRTDVVYWFFTILLTKPFARVLLILPLTVLLLDEVTSLDVVKMKAYAGYGPISRQPLWLQAIEIYVLVDFCAYWMHRLFHRGRWWPFHAVHHSSEELDWLASVRVHPCSAVRAGRKVDPS